MQDLASKIWSYLHESRKEQSMVNNYVDFQDYLQRLDANKGSDFLSFHLKTKTLL
jgi:hypothetical protein